MNYLKDKIELMKMFESFKVELNDEIFIHHPITRDVCLCKVVKCDRINCTVSFNTDSNYYGQPDFQIKKTEIIGIK